MTGAL